MLAARFAQGCEGGGEDQSPLPVNQANFTSRAGKAMYQGLKGRPGVDGDGDSSDRNSGKKGVDPLGVVSGADAD